MLSFSRKTEYALLALEHMHKRVGTGEAVTSTREISEQNNIPYPVLAKVMQKLAGKGLIKAVHGTKGGYLLSRKAEEITVENIVHIFEGPVAVAECFNEERITCPQWDGCLIKGPFSELNRKLHALLATTTIGNLRKKNPDELPTFKENR